MRAQLYVARDIGYISEAMFKSLKFKAEECSKLISSFITGLKGSSYGGLQRKLEKSKEERETEEFMVYARKELSKTLPHLYNPDGTKRG